MENANSIVVVALSTMMKVACQSRSRVPTCAYRANGERAYVARDGSITFAALA
jgi:hypothetical protein